METEKQNFIQRIMSMGKKQPVVVPPTQSNASFRFQHSIPPAIEDSELQFFSNEAKRAGLTPGEFAQIVKREQGRTTPANKVALVGGLDPNDRGKMQINTGNEEFLKRRFEEDRNGEVYNPNNATSSMAAASYILNDHRRQVDQMRQNGTWKGEFTNQDLIDSYNMGIRGLQQAKSGNKKKEARLARNQLAEIQ